MEFRQFRYLLKIAEEGSISQAAQKLYVSQPSLSQLLTSVEKKIGAQIFDRSTSPLHPTLIGTLYLQTAQQILDLAKEFRHEADDMLNVRTGHVKAGSSPFRTTHLLAPFLPTFQKNYPGIEVSLYEDTTLGLEQAVLHGIADFAVSLLPVDEKVFDYAPLFDEEVWLVLPPTHPAVQKYHLVAGNCEALPECPLDVLQNTPLVLMQKEQKMHAMALSLCQAAGFTPKVQLETRSMGAALAMAGAGIGATLLPNTPIQRTHPQPAPCYARLPQRPLRHVVIIWRRNRYLSRAARLFIEELRSYVQAKPKAQDFIV